MIQQTPPVQEKEAPVRPSIGGDTRRKRSAWRWLWLPFLVLAGALAYHYFPKGVSAPAGQETAGAGQRPRGLMVIQAVAAKAERGNIPVYLTGLGAVTPIYTVTVKTVVDGQLMNVAYTEGQMVKQGDLLAQIDPRPFQVQLEQAEGQLVRDRALLENANIDLKRYQTLWKQDAIPQQQLATQDALVKQYEGNVKTDQGQIDSAKLNLVYSRITSPITGRIGLRLVDPGNIVHAADANGLLVITQLQPITVIFTIAEDQLPEVMKRFAGGRKIDVDAFDRAMAKKLASGTLQTVDNQIDQTTGTVKMRAVFANADNSLFPSQFVNARMLVQEKSGVTLIPNAAVQRNSQSTYVWLVKPDQTVTVRPIVTGTVEGDRSEVVSGLSPGDEVITDGVDKLQEGGKVNAKLPTGNGRRPRG